MKKLVAGLCLSLLLAIPAAAQVQAPIPVKAVALTTTVVTLKAAAGQLQWVVCQNTDAAIAYVQVFDYSGAPTLGTTAPTLALPIAAQSTTVLPVASQYFNAIKVAATTGPTNNTAPATALNCNFGIN